MTTRPQQPNSALLNRSRGRRAVHAVASVIAGICLLVVLAGPAPASAANTCSGRNGKVAVITYLNESTPGLTEREEGARERPAIGILLPNHRLQTLHNSIGGAGDAMSDLSFSCSGKAVVYTEDNGADCLHLGIFNVVADKPRLYPRKGGGLTTQFPTPHLCASNAAFLANGAMVFAATGEGRKGGTYLVRPDGSHLRRLFGRQELAVSPDGRWFVVTDPRGNFHKLYLLNSRGRVIRSLTPPSPKGSEYLHPHFSPDGRSIVYEARGSIGGHVHGVIYVVRRDGTRRRRLTFGPESASEPTFSPDGRWIAFTHSKAGPGGLVSALSVSHPAETKKLSLSAYQDPAWASR